MTKKRLLPYPLIIVGLALFILSWKTAFLTQDFRYLRYGTDTPRELGYALGFIKLNYIDPYTSHRLGIPLVSYISQILFSLPPSQTLLLPLWLVNLGVGLNVFLLSFELSHRPLASALLTLMFAISYAPPQLNHSSFYSRLIAPLILLCVLRLTQSTGRRSIMFAIFYAGLSIFGWLNYPILAYLTAVISSLLILVKSYRYYRVSLLRLVYIINLLVPLFHAFLIFYHWGFRQTFDYFLDYIFALNQAGIDHLWGYFFLSFYFLFQLFLLVGSYFPRSVNILFNVIIWSTRPVLLNRALKILVLIVLISVLSRSFSFNQILLLYNPLIYLSPLIILSTIFFRSSPTVEQGQTRTKLLLGLYFFILISYFLNPDREFLSRFLNYFSLFGFISLIMIFPTRFNLWFGLIVVFIATITWSDSWRLLKIRYPDKLPLSLVSAMDWYNTLPQYQRVVWYTSYFALGNLTGHEKYLTQSFTASIIPWDKQYQLGKCHYRPQLPCPEQYRQFINEYNVNYLILRGSLTDIEIQKFVDLGSIIYADSTVDLIILKTSVQ